MNSQLYLSAAIGGLLHLGSCTLRGHVERRMQRRFRLRLDGTLHTPLGRQAISETPGNSSPEQFLAIVQIEIIVVVGDGIPADLAQLWYGHPHFVQIVAASHLLVVVLNATEDVHATVIRVCCRMEVQRTREGGGLYDRPLLGPQVQPPDIREVGREVALGKD